MLARRALAEGLVRVPDLAMAAIVAAGIHVLDVGHNVFQRW